MEDRLTELEIKMSLTEDLVDELNRTIYRQEQKLELLQQQLRHLHRQMQMAADSSESPDSPDFAEVRNLRDEIPPHY
jgi:SlyX protein